MLWLMLRMVGTPIHESCVGADSATGNMIYVSIQYRLGMWGFLSGSEIAQNGVLNAGLLDQRAALEWIQRNIRAFGESA